MNIDSDKLSIILDGLEDAVNSHPSAKFRQGGHRVLSHIRDEIKSGELTPKRVYARAPSDCPPYFTPGEEYELLFETDDERIIFIKDDEGDEVSCDWTGDIQDSSPWERVEK